MSLLLISSRIVGFYFDSLSVMLSFVILNTQIKAQKKGANYKIVNELAMELHVFKF
jgi:hypothetical protein